MNRTHFALLTALLLPLTACSHRIPEATIAVVDTSLSITPRAEKAALDAVRVHIERMQRGDLLILIPITGDAANETGGHILRLSAPIRREAFDADLRHFHEQAGNQLAAWAASLDLHQSKTDILGALDAAQQEFVLLPQASQRQLIVISDFLEDDVTYRFISARELARSDSAAQLAANLRDQHGFKVGGVPSALAVWRAVDYAALPAQQAFRLRLRFQ